MFDEVFSDLLLRDIRRNWPGLGYFVGEIPGNYTCSVPQFVGETDSPWKRFTFQILPAFLVGVLSGFAELIEKKFPGERKFSLSNYSLMQSEGSYGGHDVHTHHYHDPTWVLTILVYLDPENNGHEGTTVMKVRDGLDESEVAAQTLNWHDLTEELKTIDYKAGRAFAFFETPISFHKVKPSRKGALFGRRILRFHITANPDHCQRLYGVDLETYQKKRQTPSKDPEVLEWMKKDIDLMKSPIVLMTREEREKWASEVVVFLPAGPNGEVKT